MSYHDPRDVDHVVGALLAMPSTPNFQPASAPQPLQDDEDVDIFTLLLNELDATPRGHAPKETNNQPNIPPAGFTPGGEVNDLSTAFTWADALNSEAIVNSSSYFFESTATNETNEIPPLSPSPATMSTVRMTPDPPSQVLHPTDSYASLGLSMNTSSNMGSLDAFASDITSRGNYNSGHNNNGNGGGARLSSSSSNSRTSLSGSKDKKKSGGTKVNERKLSVDLSLIKSSDDGDDVDSLGDNDGKLTPKSHAIREKNREAVRKCRQKKKEREDALTDRIRLLEAENEEIRVQLRLGSEDRIREVEMETNRRAKRIEDLLEQASISPSPEIDEQLSEACNSYMVHSQERAEDRSAALSGALSRVSRLIDPTMFAKFYLWHGTAKDDYFTNPHGLWASISAEMKIQPEQIDDLSERREKLELLRAQIMDVSCKLNELQTNVTLKEKVDVDGVFQKSIQALMTPTQLARFILWIRKDPAVQQVTNSSQVLSSFLDQVTEPSATDDFARISKAREQAAEAAVANGRKSRLELARERIIILMKGLWDAPKESLESIAIQGLTPDVKLIDPNNGGEYHGIHKAVQYVHRIRVAFGEKMCVDLREMSLEKDKARATWVLQGTYRGRLGSKASQKPTSPAEELQQAKHLKHVSFVIVCTYRFKPGSTLIQEMLVAWDALGLMRQIGLLKQPGNEKAETEAATKRIRTSTVSFAERQQVQHEGLNQLAQVFASNSDAEICRLVKNILHRDCVFQDSYMGFEFRGVEACEKYVHKVRSPFPELTVSGVKTSQSEGAALGSPIRLDWTIKAKYSGPLVKNPTDCCFNAVLFVTFDEADHTIDSVHFSWNAQRLMDQLGIMRKN